MKLPAIITTLVKTVTSLKNYGEEVEQRTSYLVWYFLLFAFSISLLSSSLFVKELVPQFTKDSEAITHELLTHYPPDLVFSWDGTTLTSSHSELTVHFPSLLGDSTEYGLPQTLAKITSSETRDSVENAQTYLAIITPTKLHLQEATATWSEFSLNSLLPAEPQTVTKQTVETWLATSQVQLQSNKSIISGALVFTFTLLQLLFTTIGLVWKSVLVYLFSRLFGVKTKFIYTFRLSILMLVPALLVQLIGNAVYPNVTFDFTNLTFWLVYMLLIWTGPLEKVLPTEKATK